MDAMSDLTVDPQIKIEARQDIIYISTPEALLLICPHCTNTRNVYLHHIPTHEQMSPNGTLATGSTQYPSFRQCKCYVQHGEEFRVLADLTKAIDSCESIGEVRSMIRNLASQLEMEAR
jgi:hypothetical protein